jgi:Ser/Thr protein kinase RdoA (MazF antagonist)
MNRGGAHFSSEELVLVLSHYDIGVIQQVKPLYAGNKRAPKMVIISDKGKFLVKRRPHGKDDLYRVAFAHAVQAHLAKNNFPVTCLVETNDEHNTILQLNNHIYEFFKFVTGVRYDGSAGATTDTGRQLAKFHKHLADFATEWKPLRGSFHDSSTVRRHLKTAGVNKSAMSDMKLQEVAEPLMGIYNDSSVRVNQLGFDSWPEQVVHGDWHPGNMLFDESKIIAVLDFDSAKLSAPVTDLANGMLQFSIVGNRPNPADWPDYCDQTKLIQFLNGYREVIKLDKHKLESLVDLMIETIIAEGVMPIAATGFFGNLSGTDFLKMIRRKAEWLKDHRDKLIEAMKA